MNQTAPSASHLQGLLMGPSQCPEGRQPLQALHVHRVEVERTREERCGPVRAPELGLGRRGDGRGDDPW